MRIANVNGRSTLLTDDTHGVDIETASEGRFSSELTAVYDNWSDFTAWAASADTAAAAEFSASDLGAPSPAARQIFAIGLNYREHAAESGMALPDAPVVFTKFQSSVTGPNTTVDIPLDGHTDWETELVVVIGKTTRKVSVDDAWSYVAGLSLGQDLSERILQSSGPVPQFSLGKSLEGYAPIGPWLATPDEFADPDNIELGCSINGVEMQHGRTSDLIFSVSEIISRLSNTVTLYAGDVIFTGTPSGVGLGRNPQVFLAAGDELVTWAEGLGQQRQVFTAS
ncbi:fumarylacetoacetate hydrolase family protein [Subtercola lobariae]|uniref:Fumarylacetoacetate hydrolase n=1 Tax=Subtercola lobariae TaxID=1588641 RepID=A0A917EY15_9MICO|nr:fumarylacetoacetate hydrolase family protein [Subtercola lobariae]GGF30943.1 fumarylacetoacetate hydrolase [Subtercola lobariae]